MVPADLTFCLWLWLFYIIYASGYGVAAGGLTCLMLRQHWGAKSAAVDAVVAFVLAFVAMFAHSVIENSLGVLLPGDWLLFSISTGGVVVRYFILRISKVHGSTARTTF